MKRLKIILHSNFLYIFLIVFIFIYCLYNYLKPINNNFNLDSKEYIGIITNYKIKDNLLTLEIKGNEKIVCFYYFNNLDEISNFKKNYNLGDKIKLYGSFSIPSNNTIPNLFNYKKYLRYKGIYVLLNCDNFNKISDNKNFLYKIKNVINKYVDNYKSSSYIKTFILGNKSSIDSDIYESYKNNGISHLLAISGMHISLFSGLLLFLLKKLRIKENKSYLIVILFLFLYLLIIGKTPSLLRSILLFSLIFINRRFELNISSIKLFILVLFIVLLLNPFYIFDAGFLFSFVISFYLILFSNNLKDHGYFFKLLYISFLCFCVSLPISIYYFYEVNLLSIFLNIIFVPLISFIIFPLTLIAFLFPIFDNLLFIMSFVLEKISLFFNEVSFFRIVLGRPGFIFIILYYLFITLFFKSSNEKIFLLIIVLLVVQYNKNLIFNNSYIIMIDVGQGDSILIHNNKNILIDTGGIYNKNISEKKLVPLFKSLGIRKIDYLILSHGDYDHMGEAINLVNNFKVDKVIFNCGEINDLEKNLINVLDKKKIPYYSCIKELNIDNNKLYFLQTKEYDNENDNSNVIYTEIDGYKFMFMGDASTSIEKEILNKYNLPDIDVLKVGHHGSRTSSSESFINEINPKFSIISVGKNNRYGHPNKEVLNILDNSKIYRTDDNGSIMFKIKNNKLNIETCSP